MTEVSDSRFSVKSYVIATLITFSALFALDFSDVFIAVSRVSGYFDSYNGYASYTEVPAYFHIDSIITNPSENESNEVLRYGMRLDRFYELKVSFLKTAIDQKQIGQVFISPKLLASFRPSKDTMYYGMLDLRGSRYSIWSGKQHFQVYYLEQVAPNLTAGNIDPMPDWNANNKKYVLLHFTLLLIFSVLIASLIAYMYDDERPRAKRKLELASVFIPFLLLFIVVNYLSASIEKVYFTEQTDLLVEYTLPLIITAIMIVVLVVLLVRNPKDEDALES